MMHADHRNQNKISQESYLEEAEMFKRRYTICTRLFCLFSVLNCIISLHVICICSILVHLLKTNMI